MTWCTAAAVAALVVVQAWAQDGVRCDLRSAGQPASFRIGEVIDLELACNGAVPGRYVLDPEWRDYRARERRERSSRTMRTSFVIQPDSGTHDPLQLYLASPFGMLSKPVSICGNGFESKALGTAPATIHIALNDWVAFDRPGKYRLNIARIPYYDETLRTSSTVSSSAITLEILAPDAAWQADTLERLERDLARKMTLEPGERPAAAVGLRHLGTPAAARAMARLTDTAFLPVAEECAEGLITSPSWRAGLDEMRRLLRDPDFAIPNYSYFTGTLAILESAARRDSGPGAQSAEALTIQVMVDVIAALPWKTEKAADLTQQMLETAIQYARPAARRAMVGALIRVFERLPFAQQKNWLYTTSWDNLRTPQWTPVLRRLAAKYRGLLETLQGEQWEVREALLGTLRRWYELDPRGARQAVLRELVSSKPAYSASDVGIVPDASLPDH